MKKFLLALLLICAMSNTGWAFFGLFKSGYKDGVYEGEYQAADGENTRVVLTIKDGRIVDCVLEARDDMGNIKDENHGKDGSAEDYRRAQRAVREMKKYPALLIEHQDMDKFDALTGASITYSAMREAVKEALGKAK